MAIELEDIKTKLKFKDVKTINGNETLFIKNECYPDISIEDVIEKPLQDCRKKVIEKMNHYSNKIKKRDNTIKSLQDLINKTIKTPESKVKLFEKVTPNEMVLLDKYCKKYVNENTPYLDSSKLIAKGQADFKKDTEDKYNRWSDVESELERIKGKIESQLCTEAVNQR